MFQGIVKIAEFGVDTKIKEDDVKTQYVVGNY